MAGKAVFFGEETVSPQEKEQRVRSLFDSVAGRYDLMNDLMSLGMHRLWKARAATMLRPRPGDLLIDVAGGTGDMAEAFLGRAARFPVDDIPAARAVVCDFSEAMLLRGRSPSRVCGDAACLPFADACADAISIVFGLRNIADMSAACAEFRRVLAPDGRFLCMEFARPDSFSVRRAYDGFSRMLPLLGRWVARDEDAYRYLVESIRSFPDRESVVGMIEDAGFTRVQHRNMAFGIVTAYTGRAA